MATRAADARRMSREMSKNLTPDEAEEERASLIGLGLAVERLREDAHLTREGLAKNGGLSVSTIAQLEGGLKEQPKWGLVRRLAKGLGVGLDELTQLAIDLSPGEAGERLRRREREGRKVDIDRLVTKSIERNGKSRRGGRRSR